MQPKRLPGLMAPYADPHAANAPQPGNPHHANGPSAPGAPMDPFSHSIMAAIERYGPNALGLVGAFANGVTLPGAAVGGIGGKMLGHGAMEALGVPDMVRQRSFSPAAEFDQMPVYQGQPFQAPPRNKRSPQDF